LWRSIIIAGIIALQLLPVETNFIAQSKACIPFSVRRQGNELWFHSRTNKTQSPRPQNKKESNASEATHFLSLFPLHAGEDKDNSALEWQYEILFLENVSWEAFNDTTKRSAFGKPWEAP
jgi:hypothetical protein